MGTSSQHIVLPKSVLKRFSNSGVFFYLQTAENAIKRDSAHGFYSIEEYYSDEVEKALSDEQEKYLGLAYKRLNGFSTTKQFSMDENDKINLLQAIILQSFRNPKTALEVKEKSLMDKIVPTDISWYSNWLLRKENRKRYVDSILSHYEDYEPNIILNKTEVDFVLPSTICYGYGKKIVIPLDTKKGFLLMPKEESDEYISNGKHYYASVTDPTTIYNMNKMAIDYETKNGIGIVIAPTKSTLIELQDSV